MPVAASHSSDKSLDGRLLTEVNAYRNANGGRSLVRNGSLDQMAREHSQYLMAHRGQFTLKAGNVSHMGFEGRAMIARNRLNIDVLGENVASAKTDSAQLLVKMWAASKGHDFNMRGGWTDTGIGVAVDKDGTVFATQLFGTPHDSTMAMDAHLHQY